MITDLRPDLDRSSVNSYINGLIAELDKLETALLRDSKLESLAQAELTKQLKNYIKVTQIYPEKPNEEIPPR